MAINRELQMDIADVKFALIRRDPYSLFQDLPKWMEQLHIKEIVSVHQTESNGNITISLFYR